MIVTALTEMFGLKASHCAGADGQCIRWAFGGNRIQRRRTGAGWRRLRRQHLVALGVVPRLSANDRLEVNWEATRRDRLWPFSDRLIRRSRPASPEETVLRRHAQEDRVPGVGTAPVVSYLPL